MTARFAKIAVLFSVAIAASLTSTSSAQLFFRRVGGVNIDARGVIDQQFEKLDQQTRQQIEQHLQNVDDDIQSSTKLRMISLRGLEAAIADAHRTGEQLSAEVQYLAGLQRVEFVVLSPETNDVILAGPAEGWKVDDHGSVVGISTNRPVIHLEDFLVAMRSVNEAATGAGISVSIDPTQEGVRQLSALFAQIGRQGDFDPSFQTAVERAMGDQAISLTGVPKDSRFAHVLVAADYKMKRIAMGLEKSPIEQLPSMLDLAVKKRVKQMKSAPRFWMECNYQPLAKSEDSQVWQLRGQGVKTLTEDSRLGADGKPVGKANRIATKWADLMTEHFEELASADATFGELRNAMDLSVVAALMAQQQLTEKVGLEIPGILGLTEVATTPTWTVPKKVATQCSFVRLTRSWLVTASGGVSVDSWGVAEKHEVDASVAEVAKVALNKTADRWWWNAAK